MSARFIILRRSSQDKFDSSDEQISFDLVEILPGQGLTFSCKSVYLEYEKQISAPVNDYNLQEFWNSFASRENDLTTLLYNNSSMNASEIRCDTTKSA